MNVLTVRLTLRLRTAFHTTGNLRRPGVDKSLSRDPEGRWVIPATTLKGFLREKAEILLRSWGHAVCLVPNSVSASGYTCSGEALCLVCRVFGNPRRPSAVRFADAVPLAPEMPHDADSAIRTGVAISRHRRAAYPQRLFFVETTPAAPSEWVATGEGWFPDEHSAQEAAALLGLAAAWGVSIGGGRTRGLGWIEECRVEAALDGKPVPRETLAAFWQAWKEGKDVAED